MDITGQTCPSAISILTRPELFASDGWDRFSRHPRKSYAALTHAPCLAHFIWAMNEFASLIDASISLINRSTSPWIPATCVCSDEIAAAFRLCFR